MLRNFNYNCKMPFLGNIWNLCGLARLFGTKLAHTHSTKRFLFVNCIHSHMPKLIFPFKICGHQSYESGARSLAQPNKANIHVALRVTAEHHTPQSVFVYIHMRRFVATTRRRLYKKCLMCIFCAQGVCVYFNLLVAGRRRN